LPNINPGPVGGRGREEDRKPVVVNPIDCIIGNGAQGTVRKGKRR